MKHLIAAITLIATALVATAAPQTLTVDPSTMSQQEFAQYQALLKSQAQPVTPIQINEWAEAGKAMGGAFKECWSAISSDVERFANSPAGTWTAVLVTWKVAGKDLITVVESLVRWVVGITMIAITTLFMIPVFWHNCVRRKTYLECAKGEGEKRVETYRTEHPIHADIGILYAIIYVVLVGVSVLVGFAG